MLICTSVSFADRAIQGFETFNQYRDIGDYRLWSFIAKDSLIGTFVSQVKNQITIDNTLGYVLEQHLKLDYNKISSNLTFDISNRHIVSDKGVYLGDNMKLTINGQTEESSLERKGTEVVGFTTRNDQKIDQKLNIGDIKFAVENNYIDELELFLATQDITVGTEINDSIFMSQSLIHAQIFGIVEDFKNVQLYNQVFDSCFRIEFTYPTLMTAYFTPDKRLVKLVVPSQELKIYQDAVTNPLKTKLGGKKATETIPQVLLKPHMSIGKLLLMSLIYFVIGASITLFFIKKIYKNVLAYIALLVSSIIFIIIPFTQIPLQEYLFTEIFVPHVIRGGESALFWGLFPALTAGVMQELLILVTLILFFKYFKVKEHNYLPIGAIFGFGFGFIEAAFLAYGSPESILLGVNLIERIFLIMFHISSAVFLSYALKENIQKALIFVIITIVLNSTFRYFPVFVQNKIITPELMTITLALISVIFFASTVFLSNKKE